MRSRIRDTCGLRVCIGALLCLALGFAGAAAAGVFGLTITSGPTGTITTNVATFEFATKYPARFECSLTGVSPGDCGTGTTGTTSYSTLSNGAYTFTVVAAPPTVVRDAVIATTSLDTVTQSFTVAVPPVTTTTPFPPPNTVITKHPESRTTSTTATFRFISDRGGARFACWLDGKRYSPCSSGTPLQHLSRTQHTFQVAAYIGSEVDPSPAQYRWTIGPRVPQTVITRQPRNSRSPTALIAFKSIPRGARFQCSIDGGPFRPCTSPMKLTKLRAGDHRFSVRAHNESGIDASPASVKWRIRGARPWIPAAAGGAGGLLLVFGVGLALRRRRFRLSLQLQASDEEPTGRCEGRGWRCHKELTLKPGRREIAHVNATAGRSVHELDEEVVSKLNEAVDTYRRAHDPSEEVRLALLPIADEILRDVHSWLERERNGWDESPRQVELEAHLEGGKAECVLTPFRCTKGSWRKRRPWKIEVADERDEPVATILHPGTSVTSLVGHLAGFVAQVDVADDRVPEAAAVPHS